MSWPELQGQELALLKGAFTNPRQLQAAFDSRDEAAELIEVFLPGINRDGKYQRADVLVAWAQENESAIKRQRRESLQGMWEVLPQQRVVPKLTDTFDELARSNPLVLLPALQRKRRLLRENTDATQRAKEEQLAKKKYALQLAEILKEAKLPLVLQLEGVDRPEEVWPRIFGTRRSKTLRNRLKAWEPFRTWLQCVHEVHWPTSVRQLIDYSNERFQSECGKTVLNSFQASLAVLEQVGKVAETQRLSSDTTWMAHLKSLTADLVGAQAPVQQAPMITVAMIISLELHISREDEPEYARAMAFVALLAVYGSMRMDDLQGMLPATMRLTAQGFKATLGRTKTTGADRRNKEVSVFIHRQAGLSGFDWLGEGFALWKKYTQPRDYLVMTARDDWKGPTKHFAKSEVVAGYVREIFKRLATPKFEDGAYRLNVQRYLLVEGARGFFTGHSPRNWLTSAAAVLGWSKDQRDFLGRWMIGGSGSADYTRTAREVVHRIQIGVCKAIVTGQGGEYQESEALEELKAFVDERGGSGALARRRHDILRTVEGVRCLGNKWPAIEQDDADASEEEEAAEAMTVDGSATKYFISISRKTGHRRLHLNGPCHVKPHHCNRVEFVERVALEQIDRICRDCKHRMKEDQGAEDDQDTSSESGSTSDSSSVEGCLHEEVWLRMHRGSVGMFLTEPRDFQLPWATAESAVSVAQHSAVSDSMALPSEADQRAEVAKMDSDLQYVLQEASASLATQYQVARLHQSRRRFQAIADNREGARTAARDFGINPDTPAGRVEVAAIVAAWELAKEYASKEIELRAEAKVLGHKRILQVQERQAMLKAVTDAYGKMNESETPSAEYLATKAEECESNEPLASSLDRISSKKDSQVESLQTSIDPTGHVRVTKTMQKLEMPHHSEGYRRLMKVEAHAFVEYILGDRVGNLKLPTASGLETQFNRELRAVREDPSLKDSSMQKVTSANHFVDQCLKATVFAAEAGNFFMWEAPEHLGRTADGLVPSSIWAWPELLDCIPRFAATTFVHYLCEFGADMAKPTRYLSNLPFFRHSPRPFTGLPVLDADQRYVGPLPASCPHGGHAPSTGKLPAAQKWNLPRARGWPLQLCQFMVAAIDFSLQADGVLYLQVAVPRLLLLPIQEPTRESTSATPGSAFTTGAYCKGGLVGLRHHSTVLPKSTQVLTRYLQQVAPGFQASAIAIFDDVRTGVHRDARNAHYPNMVVPLSDFEDGQIWLEQQGGDVWETTPEGQRPGVHLEVCKGPVSFDAWRSYHATRSWKGRRVVMVAYMTDKLGNVEAADLAHLKTLGFKLPLDLDASNGRWTGGIAWAQRLLHMHNPCKVDSSPFAGEKLETLRKQWAGLLGAENNPDVLEIPDAQPFLLRALSLSAERLEDPDWQILTEGVDCAMQEIPLAATADVSAAHRLVLHRKSDWALMSCRAEQGLYGIIGRVVTRCLLQHAFYHFAYVDDVHPTFYGKRMYINFLVWLILQEMIGVPFAYHKFKGKTLVAFIGYELDYGARLVGLSEARGAWVCNWVDEARKARFVVSVRKFAEFLGRLGFVSRVVYWIKPHLAPLYAWSAAASKSHVAKMPDTVILTLLYLEATFKDINFKVAPGRQREETGHLFHTDAKCDDGYVVLGGWDSSQDLSVAPWFSIVVKPADAPYLFDEGGKSQWASASAELLATLAALWIFGHLKENSSRRRLPVAIAGATDNQSNEKLLRKQSTTKWPLMLINMQLSHLLRKACLRLSLTWKPRDENKLADALTNQDFSSFSSEHRLDVSFSELPLELLNQLWLSKSDFDASRKALQSASSFQPRVPKRKREGTPW
ncbi:unnamed protein product [Symbiodinium sp. CCMP2592]|nr:unnamed protein product [Symbiodinium sp. CCMP2592]